MLEGLRDEREEGESQVRDAEDESEESSVEWIERSGG